MLNKFIIGLLASALQDERIRAFMFELVERLAARLLPNLAAVIPAATGAGIKAFGELLDHVNLPSLPEVTETIRAGVNELVPDDVDIPILSDAFEKATGIDLSDILTGRNR